jgi:hypothetical protein
MKDLIIGNASGYDWDQLKYWINSIKKSGFEGDVVIVGTDMTKKTIDKLTSVGVQLELYGEATDDGGIKAHRNGVPHVERFFYIWNYLNNNRDKYDRVIATDTRDVVFQTNPSKTLDDMLVFQSLISSSEGLRYENEPWGNANLFQAFGAFFHKNLKRNFIQNVGVLAGTARYMESLMIFIFQLSLGRPVPIVDQAVYNFLINQSPFFEDTFFSTNAENWAIQLGTTIEAVKAGSGEIGKSYKENPSFLAKYNMNFEDVQPKISDEGLVTTHGGFPYTIVHQYDRIPSLREKIEKKFGE